MEIKVQDLRVGNLYIGYDDNYDIVDCDLFKMVEDGIDLYEIIKSPVILDEEILLKCGFVQGATKYIYHYVVADWYHIAKVDDGFVFRGLGASIVKVETLHHLQNLIFSLTRQELNTSGL